MRRYIQQSRGQLVGWMLAVMGTVVYALTMEPTASLWDCGEFIVTSYGLEVGHPPGAPVYQLLAHLFTLLAGKELTMVAWWSNMLSAVAGGLTVAFLFWSMLLLMEKKDEEKVQPDGRQLLCASVGAMCYLFSDTAWFSAVESEVYSLAMLFASMLFWIMLRWNKEEDEQHSRRWVVLLGMTTGLSACVHELCLLAIPTFVVIYLFKRVPQWRGQKEEGRGKNKVMDDLKKRRALSTVMLALLFFVMGLTPYLILPIRAHANPPLNEGDPSTWPAFKSYMAREQYAKAPLYPRIWRDKGNDRLYYADWSGNHAASKGKEMKDCVVDNVQFFISYQVWYMYGRYLMWNYCGRYNDRQGYGSLQNGQFVTGIPIVDKMLVGTGKRPPKTLHTAGHNVYYMLPFLLGVIGLVRQSRRNKGGFWSVLTLFLFSGVLLALYLNMPAYQPRERDYAFVLSFYAFAIWIGYGAEAVMEKIGKMSGRWHRVGPIVGLMLMGVPMLMACQNWDDHDRSGRSITRDYARNYLNACDKNAILFTYGDNDTFPLWYMQEVEQCRKDIQVINLSLLSTQWYQNQMDEQLRRQGSELMDMESGHRMGPYAAMMQILDNNEWERPVYMSHYALMAYGSAFEGRTHTVGYSHRVRSEMSDSVAVDEFANKILSDSITWGDAQGSYIDGTMQRLLDYYWGQVLTLADNLIDQGDTNRAAKVLGKTVNGLGLSSIDNPSTRYRVVELYERTGQAERYRQEREALKEMLREELAYFRSMTPRMRQFIPTTVEPREKLWEMVQ